MKKVIAMLLLLVIVMPALGAIQCYPTPTPTKTPIPTPVPTPTLDPYKPYPKFPPVYDLTPYEFKYRVGNLYGNYVWTSWGFTQGSMIYKTDAVKVTNDGMYVRMVVPTKYAGSKIFFRACDDANGAVHCSGLLKYTLPTPTDVMPCHCHTYNSACTGC